MAFPTVNRVKPFLSMEFVISFFRMNPFIGVIPVPFFMASSSNTGVVVGLDCVAYILAVVCSLFDCITDYND